MKKLLTLALFFFSLGAFSQERIALVIGNADYQISALKNALNDAQDIAKALENLDFKVTLVENADKKTMKEAIYDFGDMLNKDTVSLFYYAGHAIQFQGENYLIPINALPEIKKPWHYEDEAVRSARISKNMEESGSKLNFIFLDACRNNPIPAVSRGITQGLTRSQDAEGSLIAFSTSPGSTAEDGEGRNSPYTKNLLKYINTPNQPIELMLKDVKKAVSNDTNGSQLPWYESSITGNFCFKTTSEGCAEFIQVIYDPFLEGIFNIEELNFKNDDQYIGQVKDGQPNGKGILSYKIGAKYQGEFLNGKKHGEGLVIKPDGSSFEGNFINGMKEGKGTLNWINGAKIQTDWKNDVRIYSSEPIFNKNSFSLNFLNYSGLGDYTFISGAHYEGQFKDNLFNGYGIYVGAQGSRYTGQFKNGKKTGNGTLIQIDGSRLEGSFINGSLNGQGHYSNKIGDSYFGEFVNDKFNGQGVLTINNVAQSGQFVEGKLNGSGSEKMANGDYYEGGFINGSKHGQGTLNNSNGDIYSQSWESGKLIYSKLI